MRILIAGLLVVLSSLAQAAEANPSAAELLAKVQTFYERTQDLTAEVRQKYAFHAMKRTLEASGTMQLKKPGFLRWDVVKPYPRQYVVDGKALYAFDSEDNEVVVKSDFSADTLSTSVSFLWGNGQLSRDFEARLVERPEYGTTVLELSPRGREPGISKLYFDVDAATGLVRTSVVIDSEGNENRLTFSNVKTNAGLDAARFLFSVPKGATVTKR